MRSTAGIVKRPPATLSKSQYLKGMQCRKMLWLYRERKDLIPEASPSLQMLFDQGREIGRLAHQRFPGGTLIAEDHARLEEALASTQKALKSGAKTLYEPAILAHSVLVRCDILIANKDGTWDLIEVKQTAQVKDVYLDDLAIQRHVLEGAGLRVRKTLLMHVNTEYVREGEIDPHGFFALADKTDEVEALMPEVGRNVETFLKVAKLKAEPAIDIGPHCSNPYECDFTDYCWKHVPEYSIYDLRNISGKKIAVLKERGVLAILEMPDDIDLTAIQELQVAVARSGRPHIDRDAIAASLKDLVWPLHFLDFETINPAIPLYDGMRPYQKLPFQASIHVQRKPGGPLEHFDYLGDAKSDPRPELVRFLVKTIRPAGSVLAYNKGFEGTCLRELAEAFPESAEPLQTAERRLWDIADPFRKGHYLHPSFKGSWSIKSVLPALVPDLSYEGLAITNGKDAQVAYLNLLSGKLDGSAAKSLRDALRAYCAQDSLGMVRLLDHLLPFTGGGSSP